MPLLCAAGHAVFAPTLTSAGERAYLLTSEVGLQTNIQDILAVLEYEDLQNVAHLVYLDAFVPADGESIFDLGSPALNDRLRLQAAAEGDGWRISPPGSFFGVTDEADPRTYIRCVRREGTSDPRGDALFNARARRVQSETGWRYHELPTGHDAMVTMPLELTDLLLEVTQIAGAST